MLVYLLVKMGWRRCGEGNRRVWKGGKTKGDEEDKKACRGICYAKRNRAERRILEWEGEVRKGEILWEGKIWCG